MNPYENTTLEQMMNFQNPEDSYELFSDDYDCEFEMIEDVKDFEQNEMIRCEEESYVPKREDQIREPHSTIIFPPINEKSFVGNFPQHNLCEPMCRMVQRPRSTSMDRPTNYAYLRPEPMMNASGPFFGFFSNPNIVQPVPPSKSEEYGKIVPPLKMPSIKGFQQLPTPNPDLFLDETSPRKTGVDVKSGSSSEKVPMEDEEKGEENDDGDYEEEQTKTKKKRKYFRKNPIVNDVVLSKEEMKSRFGKVRKYKGMLPENAVHVLRSWFLDHLQSPYPSTQDKDQLMRMTGLNEKQVLNWFTNKRKRIWKPYLEKKRKEKREMEMLNCMPKKRRTSRRKKTRVYL